MLGSTLHTFMDLRRNLKLDYIKYFSESIAAPKIRVADTRNLKFVWFFNTGDLSILLEYWSKENKKVQNMYKLANVYLETLQVNPEKKPKVGFLYSGKKGYKHIILVEYRPSGEYSQGSYIFFLKSTTGYV